MASFRMTAVMATFGGLPAATRASDLFFISALKRVATTAGITLAGPRGPFGRAPDSPRLAPEVPRQLSATGPFEFRLEECA